MLMYGNQKHSNESVESGVSVDLGQSPASLLSNMNVSYK